MTVAAKPIMSERRTALLGAGLVAIGPVTMALYTPAMPQLVQEFGTTDALIKLTLTSYFAGFAITQLICGPLTDAFGRRPVTLAFLTLYIVSTVLAAMANDVNSMLVARSLQGVGAAVGITASRAIIRDLYTGQQSARIMNTIAMVLALGPAISPTLGGFILELFGWREIFVCMIIFGIALMISVAVFQPETNRFRKLENLHPRRLARNYAALLKDPRFLGPSLLVGLGLGNIYTLATVLPFVLIYEVGLTPSQFGLGMILQSGSFILGTAIVGLFLKKMDAERLVPVGIVGMIFSSAVMVFLLRAYEPTYLTVMVPVGIFAFFLTFVLPATLTGALRDFPEIAGAASSMMGFIQFGGGIAGSLAIAAIGDPLLGMTIVIPAMPLIGILFYLGFSRIAHTRPAAAE